MRRLLTCILFGLVVSGCDQNSGNGSETEQFRIEGQVYRIPSDDIESSGLITGKYADGSNFEFPYVVVHLDDTRDYLSFDYRNNGKKELEAGVPFIWQISSTTQDDLSTFQVGETTILCQPRPWGGRYVGLGSSLREQYGQSIPFVATQ